MKEAHRFHHHRRTLPPETGRACEVRAVAPTSSFRQVTMALFTLVEFEIGVASVPYTPRRRRSIPPLRRPSLEPHHSTPIEPVSRARGLAQHVFSSPSLSASVCLSSSISATLS